MRAILLQSASGALHHRMLGITRDYHQRYAERWGFTFRTDIVSLPLCAALGWVRYAMLLEALRAGYECAIYLETDTLICRDDIDLREALMDQPLALVHGSEGEYAGEKEPPHFQAGVIYARRDARVLALLEKMVEATPDPTLPDGDGPWWKRTMNQQNVLNARLVSCSWVKRLPLPWNSHKEAPDVIVRAWHGTQGEETKVSLMAAYVGNLP